jgi:hypothetical protein
LRETAWWGWEDSNFQPNDYRPIGQTATRSTFRCGVLHSKVKRKCFSGIGRSRTQTLARLVIRVRITIRFDRTPIKVPGRMSEQRHHHREPDEERIELREHFEPSNPQISGGANVLIEWVNSLVGS